jgi:hypothetical protein
MVRGKLSERDASITGMSRKIHPENAKDVNNEKVKHPKDNRINEVQTKLCQGATIPEGFDSDANTGV